MPFSLMCSSRISPVILSASLGVVCCVHYTLHRNKSVTKVQAQNNQTPFALSEPITQHGDCNIAVDLRDNKVYCGYLEGIRRARQVVETSPKESALRDLEIEARAARSTPANL